MKFQTINKTKIGKAEGYENELTALDKLLIHLISENKRKDFKIKEKDLKLKEIDLKIKERNVQLKEIDLKLKEKDDEIAKLER